VFLTAACTSVILIDLKAATIKRGSNVSKGKDSDLKTEARWFLLVAC